MFGQLQRKRGPRNSPISIRDLDLWLPNGPMLLQGVNLDLTQGKRILISGPSGAGKSSFLRAVSGIWPYARGVIAIPEGERLLFLPQEPYLPIASLKEAATYPDDAARYSEKEIREMLNDVGLGHLSDRLEERAAWSHQLSPGERQRLAIGRALLLNPQWLFLDEATSALDEASEAKLYGLLTSRMRESTIISVAHRSSLSVFHDQRLVFHRPAGSSAYRIAPSDINNAAAPITLFD
jgi:putative ATP-binding cassette transporter